MNLLLIFGLFISICAGQSVIVSGYSDSRVSESFGIFGSCGTDLTFALTDPTNFGPGGVVTISIELNSPGIDVFNSSVIDQFDIFFTGYVPTASYSEEEKQDIIDWVTAGGVLIATTDGQDYDISYIFNLTLSDSLYTIAFPTDFDSTLIDGPFGGVSNITFSGDRAVYTNLGHLAVEIAASSDGSPNGPAVAIIPADVLAVGSGAVIFVGDVDVFTTSDCAGSPGLGYVANDVFARNVFAYAADLAAGTTLTTSTSSSTTGDGGDGGSDSSSSAASLWYVFE